MQVNPLFSPGFVARREPSVLHPFEFFAGRDDSAVTLAGISHRHSAVMKWRTHSCVPRRHSCRRSVPTDCPYPTSVSRRVSTRHARVRAPHDWSICEKSGLAPEGRQIVAQCVSTGNGVKDRRAPERGGRTGDECFFRPVPGLANLLCGPRARALGYSLSPSGLREHFLVAACRSAGQALSPANPYHSVPRNESVGQASWPVIPALSRAAAESW